jgi:hypothetical protein
MFGVVTESRIRPTYPPLLVDGHPMKAMPLTFAVVLFLAVNSVNAGNDDKKPDAKQFDEQVRPFLQRYCVECHGAEKTKGNLRLDRLAPDFSDAANLERWLKVQKGVQAGEIPPPKTKTSPPAKDVLVLSDWIRGKADAAATLRAAEGRVVLRRLNRNEYQNTIRDLLGVDVNLKEQLPQDGAADGFDNVGPRCTSSIEKYLDAAGASDAQGGSVRDGPVSPEQFGATLLHALGLREIRLAADGFARSASSGQPIRALFA